jgi:hypothetical protein
MEGSMNLLHNKALSSKLPRSKEWEFGDHIYGLEPLALPARWLPWGFEEDGQIAVLNAQLFPGDDPLGLNDAGAEPGLIPINDAEVDRLFWFRWITGHQTTFVLWQLLAATLDQAQNPDADQDVLARRARCLVRGYSLMLLYTSSPPQAMYERIIRGPMARQHPNLSGAWARDYADVRPLIRGRVSLGGQVEAAKLARECHLNQQVHEGIAARVVPSGVSLLLSSGARHQGVQHMHRDTLLWLYDGIFLTTRSPVSLDDVLGQVIRRIHAIYLDVRTNGLYPTSAPTDQHEPAELMSDDILNLKNSFDSTLRDLAEIAAPGRRDPAYQSSTS